MIVFKNYFKIVREHIGTIIMFAAISIGISIANTTYNSTEEYTNVNPTLGIINYDTSELTEYFIEYLDEFADLKNIKDDEKEIQDTLYNMEVDAVLIIPENFVSELLKGNNPTIKIKKSIQSASEYTELLVNRFLKISESYSKVGMEENEIISNIEKDIQNEIEVKISSEQKSDLEKLAIFYSFENYAFLSIFIFIIGTIMCIFNKETITKRNNISKLKPNSFSNQLFLGHIVLTLSIWVIFILASIIIYKDLMFNLNGILLIINSLCFALTATSLAYLIGTFVKNQNVLSGIQNVVGLGLSFISGCFVPIEMLDSSIINFSKIFPSYWFIQTNYDIVKISNFDFETLKPIFQNYIIILLFGITYFIISKIVNKKIIAKK